MSAASRHVGTSGGDAGWLQEQIGKAVFPGSRRGGRYQLGRRETHFDIRRPIFLDHLHRLTLVGQAERTMFHLNFGDDLLPPEQRVLFQHRSTRRVVMEDLAIHAVTYAAAATAHRKEGSVGNSNMNAPIYRNVVVEGNHLLEDGHVHTARSVDGKTWDVNNNEHATYYDCSVANVTGSAVVLAASQVKAVKLVNFNWAECGRYGVDATGTGARWGTPLVGGPPAWGGTEAWGGTFVADHCRGGGSGIAEFGIGRPAGPVAVKGGDFERVRALLRGEAGVNGPTTNAQPVFIQVERADTDADHVEPQGGFIALFNGGPLTVRDSSLAAGYVPRPGQPLPRIYHGGLGGLVTIVEGVTFGALGADRWDPSTVPEWQFRDQYPVIQERIGRGRGEFNRYLRVKGNLYTTPGGGARVVTEYEREELEGGAWP